MGADGGIYIYDKEETDKLLMEKLGVSNMRSVKRDYDQIYVHRIFGRDVYTIYYGENAEYYPPTVEYLDEQGIKYIEEWEVWT